MITLSYDILGAWFLCWSEVQKLFIIHFSISVNVCSLRNSVYVGWDECYLVKTVDMVLKCDDNTSSSNNTDIYLVMSDS